MSKIKDIQDRLIKDPKEYSGFTFLVAERTFLIINALYFITLLGTVGGFYLPWINISLVSMISYHLYSLLVITTIWFGFSWAEHIVYINLPEKRWISYCVLILLIILGGLGLFVHLYPAFQ